MSRKRTTRGSGFCPHCGNDSLLECVLAEPWVETTLMNYGGKTEEGPFVWMMSLVRCHTCKGILLYKSNYQGYSEAKFSMADLVWPHSGDLGWPVPENICRIYSKALLIKLRSPDAFAVQIRRALEALCKDRGYSGSLKPMLEALAKAGEIPDTLAKVADILRLVGNEGAHETGAEVSQFQADEIDTFFRALVEYVYIAPHRIGLFEMSRRKALNAID
jgi:Domain of unknown function (DUF4145)